MITKHKLKPNDITFLNESDVLYSLDFRVLSENIDYKIPTMWKYENILPWILSGRNVVVNENYTALEYPNKNSFVVTKKTKDPRVSIYERMSKGLMGDNIKKLWVAVPHPDADIFCKENKLKINYNYDSYLKYNNKIEQKKLLGNASPNWKLISSFDEIKGLQKKYTTGYIKRKFGSGGYTVFELNKLDHNFSKLFKESSNEWYFEEEVKGKAYSIQCVKDGKNVTVFGFSEQIIEGHKFYSGSKILSLDLLNIKLFNQVKKALSRFGEFLADYNGLFGLDFIIDKNNKVFILEANIRITAVTISTLLFNMVGAESALFREDVKNDNMAKDDVVLTCEVDNMKDVLSFNSVKGVLGMSIYVDFKNCLVNVKRMDDKVAREISEIVNMIISNVEKIDYHNFWPYGWTLSLILSNSHCVMSSWYLEKRVLVDVFSCNLDYDQKLFIKKMSDYFKSKNNKFKVELR
ncbi:MAG: ATP-grasp domain-containing protein [Candidatus Komeilibacteria bacterium]